MFLILSGIMCAVALYYLACMYDTYPTNTDYLTPLLIFLLFSITSFVREFRKILDEEPYEYDNDYGIYPTEDEYYYYEDDYASSKARGREKVKELRKSRWFRFKEGFFGFFGHDITKKYYRVKQKPVKSKTVYHSRYEPRATAHKNFWTKEYNEVTKHVGRSFEVQIES